MHELSLATSVLQIARDHTPARMRLTSLRLLAGPLRQIDPQAMQWAWHALTDGQDDVAGAALHLELPPWRMHCQTCGSVFDSADPFAPCGCGSEAVVPRGGDELLLMSIEVEEQDEVVPYECRAG